MAIPFVITEGTSIIVDKNGNLASIVPSLAGQDRLATDSTLAGGRDEGQGILRADVELKNDRHALVTTAFVSVEQIFGFDNFADTWFEIKQAGTDVGGGGIRVQIAGFSDPTGNERDVPPTDVTINMTAALNNDEILFRDEVVSKLNADPNFTPYWKASVIKDNPIVHISSKLFGNAGERVGSNAFVLTDLGDTQTNLTDADLFQIIRRGKKNSGARDPRDRRLVTVGISGEVQSVPGAAGDISIRPVTDNGETTGSPDLRVNGATTPIRFFIPPRAEDDLYITELRFFGGGNGVKFEQFLSKNSVLPNGILVELISDQEKLTFPVIRVTEDFKNKWAFGSGDNFKLDVASGGDQFLAVLGFDNPFPIRKQGTFINGEDSVSVYIRDDISSGLNELECYAVGFRREV